MSCTTCYSHICTCDNEKFCVGPKGDRGDRGDQGIVGETTPNGVSDVFIKLNRDETNWPPSIPYFTVMTYTVTEPGDYLLMFELDSRIQYYQTDISYRAAKNGVPILNTDRKLRIDGIDSVVVQKYKKNKLHAGIPSLVVGDIITIEYNNNKDFRTSTGSLTMLKTTQLTIL